ncbi:unnamed protein product [Linum trigynum]|uniref:Disease resistance protein RGA3 n=1 Tax=Linum trigynum TaxID=586398 RepID=A0AAV2DIT8_9ROSI
MAAALAELVLKKLGSLAADQAILLFGLKSEIQKLESTVSSIQAVLLDAEDQSSKSHQVRLWLRGLEEVLYDAEDLLDDFATEILQRRQMDDGNGFVNEVCRFFSPSNQVAYGLRISNQIKTIRSKLDEIDQNRKQFNFKEAVVGSQEWRQTHSSVPEVVVGREEDKQIIIDMLLSSSYKEKVAVVPIVGIGGLGKTTLAQLIYNDDKIKSHFDCTSWICVSETFQPKILIKDVLESITKETVEELSLNRLKDVFHEKIKNKPVLLVLDDVWNEDREKWIHFKDLFTSGAAQGSRIIVTTRLRIVAEMTATGTIVPYELKGLSEPESWSLFEKMAFKGGVASGLRYVEIGEGIVRKCRGVPLALRSMGGVLFFKDTESEWEAVRDRQLLNLEGDILTTTLKLSYDHLPCHLKRCFAYCCLFPKDQEIEEVTKDAYGNMESCKMHDLMHDLAVKVAGEETICLHASNFTDDFLKRGNVNLERIRHLSVDFGGGLYNEVCQVPTLLAKATRLRTFLIINVLFVGTFERSCGKIFPKMIRLRVLGLKNVTMEILSSIVHELKHLRYLDCSGHKMEVLPNEISRLVHLQVLNLFYCANLRLLPTDIGKLYNLVYLELFGCRNLTGIPAGIGNLSFLREFRVSEETKAAVGGSSRAVDLGELKRLNNLTGALIIERLDRVKDKSEAETANLKEKSRLRRLHLMWGEGMTARARDDNDSARISDVDWSVLEALQPHPNLKEIQLSYYGGASISTRSCWFSSLRNLVSIKLYGCTELRSLPCLDPFVSLEELDLQWLESLEYVQTETVASSPSTSYVPSNNHLEILPSLKYLVITNCKNLVGWSPTNTEESPLLPRVSNLQIISCPQMVSVPRFRVNFEKVELTAMSSELLSAFVASLISPPRSRFHELHLILMKDQRLFAGPTLSLSIFRQLHSLQELCIANCEVLELEDYDCGGGDERDDEHDNMPPPCVLPSLRRLVFEEVDLVTLPKWIQHSSNLHQLELLWCNKLKCVPGWLTKLTALESLQVRFCGILSGRCRSITDEDWPIVSHIPNIEVDGIAVQQDSRYLGMKEEEEEEEEREGEQHQQEEHHQSCYLGMEEEKGEQHQQEEEEASSHTLLSSRLLRNCFARMTCNLFQKCFLP